MSKISISSKIKLKNPVQIEIKLKKTPTKDNLDVKSLGYDNYHIDEVIHLSDTHIPIHLHIDRKDEYLTVFKRLYETIQKRKMLGRSPIIIITGDLLHVKLNLEAETVIMARDFLQNLCQLAPTIVIIGNHDFSENNMQRADTMTAICHGINVQCLKYSGIYQVGKLILVFSSLFDGKFIRYTDIPTDIRMQGLPIYKLYHGTVLGSVNCNGTANSKNVTSKLYPSVSDFEGYDAVLMGHIHKYQQLTPTIVYAGSLIQQNYGESIDNHGILIWDLKNHTHEFIEIENDYVFIDLFIENGQISNQCILEKYKTKKFRIRCKNHLTTAIQYAEIQTQLKEKYDICEIRTGKPLGDIPTQIDTQQSDIQYDPLDDGMENDLIEKWAQPHMYQEVNNLHSKLKSKEVTVQSAWNIQSLRFKNMFAYGNDHINEINFVEGINNICSPNMTGKTSIVNIVLYTLYDRTSHNSSSRANIIHNGKSEGFIELIFNHNGHQYLIEKKAISKKKKGQLVITFETNFYKLQNQNHPIVDRKLLNGKDSTETTKNIAQYVGDFDLFTIHNIISTKLGSSIIAMTPGEKLKHFHRLCNTDQYTKYIDSVKCLCGEDEKLLLTLSGKINVLETQIKGINIDNSNVELAKTEIDYESIILERDQEITNGQQLATQYGQIETNRNQLKSKLRNENGNCVGDCDRETIMNKIEQNNDTIKKLKHSCQHSCQQDIQQEDSHNKESQQDYSVKSLKSLIKNYQLLIKPIDINQCELDQMLTDINQLITDADTKKPLKSQEELNLELVSSRYDLKINNEKLLSLSKYKSAIEVDITITEKQTLIDRQNQLQLEKQKHNIYDNKVINKDNLTLQEAIEKITHPSQIIPLIERNEISLKLIANQRQLKNISKQLADFPQDIDIGDVIDLETSITYENIANQIQKEIPVRKKHVYNEKEIENIKNQFNHEWSGISCPEMTAILESLRFDNSDTSWAKIHQNDVIRLTTFIKLVDNGQFNQISTLTRQLNELEIKQKYNMEIDDDIKQNIMIRNHNDLIEKQLKVIEYKALIKQKDEIDSCNRQCRYDMNYYQLTDLAIYLELEEVNQKLEAIHSYESYLEIKMVESITEQLKKRISEIIVEIQWYKTMKSYIADQFSLRKKSEILSENDKYHELIGNLQIQLQIANLYENIIKLEMEIKNWDDREYNLGINLEIEKLERLFEEINLTISNNHEVISKIQDKSSKIQKQIIITKHKIEKYQESVVMVEKIKVDINEISSKINIYNEYQRLFNRNAIPFELMITKLTSFNRNVNEIFEKYTKYTFKYEQSESSKLVFLVTNRINGLIIEPERLSGFESVILQLAINHATLSITDTFRCGFIIVDESLDCIDQNLFIDQLPFIIEALRHYYQTILLISHRDVPEQVIDKQLKISHYGDYSTIN